MMVAYYRMYGTCTNSYESVLTKYFLHGRTEAARALTPEAEAFCRTFCSEESSKEEKVEALRVAIGAHSTLLRACAKGMGHDRHLYALHCISKLRREQAAAAAPPQAADTDGEGAAAAAALPAEPAFFQSQAFRTLNTTVLSTSNCGNPSLRLFGFGPVVRDGFGIGYIIKDDGIQFCAASKRKQTQRYVWGWVAGWVVELSGLAGCSVGPGACGQLSLTKLRG